MVINNKITRFNLLKTKYRFTGFLATRVGKTAALSVGGSILLVTAATQTGYVSVNWDKLNMKASQASDNAPKSVTKGLSHPQAITVRFR